MQNLTDAYVFWANSIYYSENNNTFTHQPKIYQFEIIFHHEKSFCLGPLSLSLKQITFSFSLFCPERQWKWWIMNLNSPLRPPSVSPPPPHLFLGLKTEEGNAVCVWMKLKLEAEWHCSGASKSSWLPVCVSVCVLVMFFFFWGGGGGVMRKGAPKLFHLGGHSSTNKTSNANPTQDPHRGRYPQWDKTCCSSHADESSRSSAVWILLQPHENKLFHIQPAPVTAKDFSSEQQQEMDANHLRSLARRDFHELLQITFQNFQELLNHSGKKKKKEKVCCFKHSLQNSSDWSKANPQIYIQKTQNPLFEL